MATKLQNGGVHVLSADPTGINRLGSLGHPGSQGRPGSRGRPRELQEVLEVGLLGNSKVQEVREVNEVLVVQNKRELWEARAKTQASVEPVNLWRSTDIICFPEPLSQKRFLTLIL